MSQEQISSQNKKIQQADNKSPQLNTTDKKSADVRVVFGVHEQYYNFEGQTVSMVRKSLKHIYNLPKDAEALIGGKVVQDDYRLLSGDTLEFFKTAGVKGLQFGCF